MNDIKSHIFYRCILAEMTTMVVCVIEICTKGIQGGEKNLLINIDIFFLLFYVGVCVCVEFLILLSCMAIKAAYKNKLC